MPAIAFASSGKILVLLHTLAATVLLGACTHQIVVAWRSRRGVLNQRLSRIYGLTAGLSAVATVGLGALAYPPYRYFTRGLYLDHCAVTVSKLFDVKEDLAVLALGAAALVWCTTRVLHRHSDRVVFDVYLGASVSLGAIIWFNALSGFFIALTRGMP